METVKSLREVSGEIEEKLGNPNKFNKENGYFFNVSKIPQRILINGKIHTDMVHKSNNSKFTLWHFKSKMGYNSKYKNKKNYANHYAEYISYLILQQLGKKSCEVKLGEINIKNRYSNKIMKIEGALTCYEMSKDESFVSIKGIIEKYKKSRVAKNNGISMKKQDNIKTNYPNIKLVLEALEDFYIKNKQMDKIPEMRKDFFDMCAYDLIFANRDRNDDNFGIKVNHLTNEVEFYPLFDSEQILGMQEEKNDVIKYMANEKQYENFKNKYLTSYIGVPGESKKVVAEKLLQYMLENYYSETRDSLEDIGRYTYSDLEEVLEVCPNLSKEHKVFAKKIFLERQKEISETIHTYEQKRDEEIR